MFVEDKIYKDRAGNEYTYLYKSGGVTVFLKDGAKACRNVDGKYRWDDKETDKDIVDV
jgi:hypothetical protein